MHKEPESQPLDDPQGTGLVRQIPVGSSMERIYENLQHLETEEKSQEVRNGPLPLRLFLRHLCSGPLIFLLSLGLRLLLLAVIYIIGSQYSKFQRDLVTLSAAFSNFTSSTAAEVQALTSQESSLQEMMTSLRADMEGHRQDLQAAHSLNDKVLSLESRLEKQEQAFKAVYSNMLLQVQQLKEDLKSLSSRIVFLTRNGFKISWCPVNWVEHEGSCYWFSRSRKTWSEAEKYCQLKMSHLVVINSREEQNFVQEHTGSSYVWIGLNDSEGIWKWVDGTDYETNFKNWEPGQPDDWHGHGLGGGEDCAHLRIHGNWNDNACQRLYLWVCEATLGKVSWENL
ncbi:C-type lectin domain family 10 member A [Tupaia chinensis]|uniref:C-type lectin domain family 10 member A n=1 Tax=Tupaia chinensis TaxID=246437 RepID=UPI000FFBEB26|nr:C-type lectin domain family 10 member A [Tupaia chinensis]